jgi:BMFP domain-containing protein YqiC
MKPARKLELPREETRKKMAPVTREEFEALMQKAIQTPSKKSPSKVRAAASGSAN